MHLGQSVNSKFSEIEQAFAVSNFVMTAEIRKSIYLGLILVPFFLPFHVFAEDLPSAADGGRIQNPQHRFGRQISELEPRNEQKSRSPFLPEELRTRHVFLKGITVIGNSSLPQHILEEQYSRLINTTVSVGQVFEVIARIQQIYLDEGYTLTRVYMPHQDIQEGQIIIRIIEGYVESVEFSKDVQQDNLTADFAMRVQAMRPLNTRVLERLMLMLNDRPGVRLASILAKPEEKRNVPTQEGAIRLVLKTLPETKEKSFVSFDNYGSGYTGSGYFQAGTTFQRLGGNAATLALNAGVTTSMQELRRIGISFTTPLYGLSGLVLECSLDSNRTVPGEDLDPLDIKGETFSFFADINYSIIRQRDKNWDAGLSFEAKNSRTKISYDRLYEDRIRSLELHTEYNFVDSYRGYNHMQFALAKGFDMLGSRETGAVELSREEGRSDFLKLNLSLSRLQDFSNNAQMFAQVEAQYAPHPLLSSEEFGFGGGVVGRGYDPSEITGDRGWAAKAEFRYNYNLPSILALMQPYVYVDAGKVWNIDNNVTTVESATSSGIGVRYYDSNNLTVDINISQPLTREAGNPPDFANGKSLRPLLKVSKKF